MDMVPKTQPCMADGTFARLALRVFLCMINLTGKEFMDDNDVLLALTNENQRLVNLSLLAKIQAYKPDGMKGLFDRLDASLKGEGLLKYDGMRKAVNRNFRKLSDLADEPDELAEWLRSRKKSSGLQIRITPDHFLLNNILALLGIRFEDLFAKDTLPGIAEGNSAAPEIPDDDINSKENGLLLKEISSKLDEIKDKYIGRRIRKTYKDRLNDLTKYFLLIQNNLLSSYTEPDVTGFSNASHKHFFGIELKQIQIYTLNLYHVMYFMGKIINRRFPIYKLFLKFQSAKYSSSKTRRLFIPFFLLGILEQLVMNIIRSGITNNIHIFFTIQEVSTENLSADWSYKHHNTKLLEQVKEANNKTINFIKYILKNEVNPSDDFCEECEIFFIKRFKDIHSLFHSPTSSFTIWDMIMESSNISINEIPNRLKNSLKPGLFVSFNVKEEQLRCFEESIEKIEVLQKKLDEYYV